MKYSIKYSLNNEVFYAIKADVEGWVRFMEEQGLEVEVISVEPVRVEVKNSVAA